MPAARCSFDMTCRVGIGACQGMHGLALNKLHAVTAAVGLALALSCATARAATITATTATDDVSPNNGTVSLREAITAINAGNDLSDPDIAAQNPGTFGTNDTINFNIPGAGVHTINLGMDASAANIP